MIEHTGRAPFYEGWAAGNLNVVCSRCPYAPDSDARYEWLEGWSMAGFWQSSSRGMPADA